MVRRLFDNKTHPRHAMVSDEVEGTGTAADPIKVDSIIASLWPVGSVYTSVLATNPATLLGFGTWVRCAVGRVIVGVDGADSDFDAAQKTGGAKAHTLTTDQLPAHAHVTRIRAAGLIGSVGVSGALAASNADASDGATATTGGSEAHNNMPPYETYYTWVRTA